MFVLQFHTCTKIREYRLDCQIFVPNCLCTDFFKTNEILLKKIAIFQNKIKTWKFKTKLNEHSVHEIEYFLMWHVAKDHSVIA